LPKGLTLLSNVFGDLLDDSRNFGLTKFRQGHGDSPSNPFGHDTSITRSVRPHTDWASRSTYNPPSAMKRSFEQAVIDVWRQALVENAKTVKLGPEHFPVRTTPKRALRQVDFVFEGNEIRGLEQNPQTKSRWAQMARSGKKVMQFLSDGRYVANVVDGKVTLYARRGGTSL
jgi:hypothetical protein